MLVLKKPIKDLFYLDGISKANYLIFVNVNKILGLHEDKKSDCNRGRISRHCMWIILTKGPMVEEAVVSNIMTM